MIDGQDILDLGIPEGPLVGKALEVIRSLDNPNQSDLDRLEAVYRNPDPYMNLSGTKVFQDLDIADSDWTDTVEEFAQTVKKRREKQARREAMQPEHPKPFHVYAPELTDPETYEQMYKAMKIPVAKRGALMPDAHLGYGIPVGGVWGLKDAISPNAVGVDIGCRMRITIYDVSPRAGFFEQHGDQLESHLNEHTYFGTGSTGSAADHTVLDDERWTMRYISDQLQERARNQLGSSGGGNHFAEFVVVRLPSTNQLQITPGRHLALVTHSGSRGFGFETAKHFKNVAEDRCEDFLPDDYMNYAWLSMDEDSGQEYYAAMNLAGEYAAANHDIIHRRINQAVPFESLWSHDHHHNFAWVENVAGEQLIVHRKGATPAAKGEVGLIPGTMATDGAIVIGTGAEPKQSLNSCSHGAGRRMSRTKAKNTLSKEKQSKILEKQDVRLTGGNLDESPEAYKDVQQVLDAQSDLIEIEARFSPRIVRMAS